MAARALAPAEPQSSRKDLYVDVYPESWYAVAPARSLRPGEIQPLEAFGKKWVLWRTKSGAARITSRYCPHMGASLQCGHVREERIVCPFHHWEYEAKEGRCVRIPYLEGGKIPPGAQLDVLPVREHLDWIWVFNGREPTFDLIDVPEAQRSEYGVRHKSQWFDIHPLLILENGCDAQHFKYVHGVDFERYDVEVVKDEPHELAFHVDQELRGPLGKRVKIRTSIHYLGGSTIFGSLEHEGNVTGRFIASPLPVSFRRTRFHLIVYPHRLPWWGRPIDRLYMRWYAQRIFSGSTDDYLPIWRHMDTSYRRCLVSEDQLQQRFRRFYRAHLPPGTASGAS